MADVKFGSADSTQYYNEKRKQSVDELNDGLAESAQHQKEKNKATNTTNQIATSIYNVKRFMDSYRQIIQDYTGVSIHEAIKSGDLPSSCADLITKYQQYSNTLSQLQAQLGDSKDLEYFWDRKWDDRHFKNELTLDDIQHYGRMAQIGELAQKRLDFPC